LGELDKVEIKVVRQW